MGLIKKKTRRKLSKQLSKLVRKHGAETTLALVAGIVSNLAADISDQTARRSKRMPKVRTIVIRKRPQGRGGR